MDEIHFLLKCSVLENIKKATLSEIYKLYPNTDNLYDKDTIKVLINAPAFIRIITFHGEGDGHLLEARVLQITPDQKPYVFFSMIYILTNKKCVSIKPMIKGHHFYHMFCDLITMPR